MAYISVAVRSNHCYNFNMGATITVGGSPSPEGL
jgi:hypothetical protein